MSHGSTKCTNREWCLNAISAGARVWRPRSRLGKQPLAGSVNRLRPGLLRQGNEVAQNPEAYRLAFLRVELRGEHVFAPHRGGESLPVRRPTRDDRRVVRPREIAVEEIDEASVVPPSEKRTFRSADLEAVPTDLRDLQIGPIPKSHHRTPKDLQARSAGLKFLAPVKQ